MGFAAPYFEPQGPCIIPYVGYTVVEGARTVTDKYPPLFYSAHADHTNFKMTYLAGVPDFAGRKKLRLNRIQEKLIQMFAYRTLSSKQIEDFLATIDRRVADFILPKGKHQRCLTDDERRLFMLVADQVLKLIEEPNEVGERTIDPLGWAPEALEAALETAIKHMHRRITLRLKLYKGQSITTVVKDVTWLESIREEAQMLIKKQHCGVPKHVVEHLVIFNRELMARIEMEDKNIASEIDLHEPAAMQYVRHKRVGIGQCISVVDKLKAIVLSAPPKIGRTYLSSKLSSSKLNLTADETKILPKMRSNKLISASREGTKKAAAREKVKAAASWLR